MEEGKKEAHGSVCTHQCMNVHHFCSSRFCLVRCFFIIVILLGVFAIGYAAGVCRGSTYGHERNGFERDVYGYGNHMMMRFDGNRGGWESATAIPAVRGNVTYRMMGQPLETQSVTVTVTATPL